MSARKGAGVNIRLRAQIIMNSIGRVILILVYFNMVLAWLSFSDPELPCRIM